MRLIAVGLIASLAIAVPATAQTASPPATEAKEVKREKAKRVCRSIQVTGQRIPKRQCKTEAEWSGQTGRDSTEDLRAQSAATVAG